MKASHLHVIVEDQSTEAALRVLLPKILRQDLTFEIFPHQCKQDLLKHLPNRFRGYKQWLPDDWRIIVLCDLDNDDCKQLKDRLESFAMQARLMTKRSSSRGSYQVVTRLAIEELEAWFFGDWNAVCAAYPKVDPNLGAKQGYRDSDSIAGGTWEALERALKNGGYFRTGLRKIEAARAISDQMDPLRNKSQSFDAFRKAVGDL
ncbi:MAG: DUF4276 family protein [Acidobacteria bacterium]|nr:DUF4276 family protein [Acidobacteriota bacterium]